MSAIIYHAAGIGLLASVLLLVGCVSPAPDPNLIDNLLWQEVAAADDPLAEHRPTDLACSAAGAWGEEDASLEVDTGLCNYLALQQPSLREVSQGDALKLVAWHAQLWDIESTEGHFAVLFGDQLLWEEVVPIPSDPGIYDLELEAPVDLAQGEAIHFHLHNHGSNTWNFLELSALL